SDWLLSMNKEKMSLARENLLKSTCDVAKFIAECIETFPEPLKKYQQENSA
ncbi:MAG: hypothetical protein ACI9MF_001711, partial [Gammaproteobacteria bacterium]